MNTQNYAQKFFEYYIYVLLSEGNDDFKIYQKHGEHGSFEFPDTSVEPTSETINIEIISLHGQGS